MAGEPAADTSASEAPSEMVAAAMAVVATVGIGAGAIVSAESVPLAAIAAPIGGVGTYLFVANIDELANAGEDAAGGPERTRGVSPMLAGSALSAAGIGMIAGAFVFDSLLYAIGAGVALAVFDFAYLWVMLSRMA